MAESVSPAATVYVLDAGVAVGSGVSVLVEVLVGVAVGIGEGDSVADGAGVAVSVGAIVGAGCVGAGRVDVGDGSASPPHATKRSIKTSKKMRLSVI